MRWLAFFMLCIAAPAQANPEVWLERHKAGLLREYVDLLAIPNVASNLDDMRRNAELIRAMMARRGLAPQVLDNADKSAPPLVYGEWKVPGARRTLVLYAHYDGQPVTPAAWTVTQPFTPKILDHRSGIVPAAGAAMSDEWRVYARGASDDKGGVMAILAAVDVLKSQGKRPGFNLKIVFEGEEEAGSPHLAELLKLHRKLLASDGWVIVDGPAHASGVPQLNFGVRGDVNVALSVYGPARPLHSGHYGNWAPNPAMMLAQLLASMKRADGRVTIAGFYDDMVPLTASERAAIAAIPSPDAALRDELALGWTEGGGASLTEVILEPSLNINGMRSADIGSAQRNVVPSVATAALDLRLVLGNTPERQVEKLAAHIRAQGYTVLDREPTLAERRQGKVAMLTAVPGYPAERTPLDSPFAQYLIAALRPHGKLVVLPSLGGSLPLYMIRAELGAPTATLGLWNHDNNQHAEDENIRLGNLWAGILKIAALMATE